MKGKSCKYCGGHLWVGNKTGVCYACIKAGLFKKKCKHCGVDVGCNGGNYKSHISACKKHPLCLICKTPIRIGHGNVKYCSLKCKYIGALSKQRNRVCKFCGNEYRVNKDSKYYRVTCSSKCLSDLRSRDALLNVNCGATAHYRNSKRHIYKGHRLDSSWEFEIVKWFDEVGVRWRRDRRIYFRWKDVDGKMRRYTPDFYLSDLDVYVDTKNSYLMEVDKRKMQQVVDKHGITLFAGNVEQVKSKISIFI